ncbi:hypothetical protein J7T55_015665 [Diaporthe amygdali]|uniref:uncharacterized protein n=1 Tax=Phomopsis amygdali TaxID=1214568 RepID=UPI0022FDF3CB|nr:uncharacterized protein J7T55_015665 [Diaporthe amygdali]KAJ0120927.1 hypothetical protein J7T55_015665 [Diaporthe amygdali]
MKVVLVYHFIYCAILAQGSARSIETHAPSDTDRATAGDVAAQTITTLNPVILDTTPDCRKLKHRVDEDPRDRFGSQLLYDAVTRWKSVKSRFHCDLGDDNTAYLTWVNGLATNIETIKEGFDRGTCGYFKDVPCIHE